MRNQVQLSKNGAIAARQLELAHRGAITIAPENAARRLRRVQGTLTKDFAGAITELGDRAIRVQASSAARDRANDEVVQAGLWWVGPTIPLLWSHNPEMPIGRARPYLRDGSLYADCEFAPQGISPKADEVCGLCKSGVITSCSIGFDPCTVEPVNPQRPREGTRFLTAEVLELSICSVGANADATIIQRSAGSVKRRSITARHSAAVPMQPADPLEALRQNVVQARSRGSVHLCHALRAYEQARAAMISDSTYRPAVSRADAAAARAAAAAVYEQLVKGEP